MELIHHTDEEEYESSREADNTYSNEKHVETKSQRDIPCINCIDAFEKETNGNGVHACRHRRERMERKSLPPFLNLQLMRFTYDPLTGDRKKLSNPIDIPLSCDFGSIAARAQKRNELEEKRRRGGKNDEKKGEEEEEEASDSAGDQQKKLGKGRKRTRGRRKKTKRQKRVNRNEGKKGHRKNEIPIPTSRNNEDTSSTIVLCSDHNEEEEEEEEEDNNNNKKKKKNVEEKTNQGLSERRCRRRRNIVSKNRNRKTIKRTNCMKKETTTDNGMKDSDRGDRSERDMYDLFAILYHKGSSAHVGHYTADIRDHNGVFW